MYKTIIDSFGRSYGSSFAQDEFDWKSLQNLYWCMCNDIKLNSKESIINLLDSLKVDFISEQYDERCSCYYVNDRTNELNYFVNKMKKWIYSNGIARFWKLFQLRIMEDMNL